MNTVLIGKRGQLGTELERALSGKGGKVYAFDHQELDITDYQHTNDVLTRIRPDIVINTSAYHVLSECETHPEQAFLVNAIALKNLAVTCRDNKIKLVTYSTDYVFDGAKGKPYTEYDCPNPLQLYGLSKLAGEFICFNYNPDSIVIRTCGVYGGQKGSRQKGGNFVLTILEESRHKTTIDVSTEQIVSPTHAGDLAQCTVALVEQYSARGIYHLVNEGYCSWYEFAKELITLNKLSIRIRPIDRKGVFSGIKRPLFSALTNTRAKSEGIIMPSWQDGLKRYLWYITKK
ncbi:dTDP-4-dehydrorhamnose reductase [Candidatus Gottesmanbacteria bacterium RIFCSPLOWO2_01_FULL_49_10]|uniref:dTDP-4-dehydrorhamnose reductase n=1 Tax=Candidatus Gottesmanbacteria bacterium RIFCSPLOWO2_01_FULL_49_10 TaxID=1798396 RepID=A0A1F6AWR2_9BACT|nr:MAG: dTDP-4-dehydrorhamnose reductase [Microgenomates group bacterium GW2011_GWA2_47_8]OGG29100.1 MAG: dTDP-4-dehydrorhamnose reductase [Candidatus Gottesmanbacteria bacterium RIFCSPLOWO2_01_FULL_49_10]